MRLIIDGVEISTSRERIADQEGLKIKIRQQGKLLKILHVPLENETPT